MLHYVPKTVCLYLALQVDPRAWKARGKQNKLTIKNPVIWPNFWGQAKDSRTKHDQGYKRYSGIKVELSAGPAAPLNRVAWKRDASCTVPRQVVESAATLFRTPRGHSKETCAKPCRCRDVHVDAVNPVTGTSWKLWFFQIHICISNSITMRQRNKQEIQELTQKCFRHLANFSCFGIFEICQEFMWPYLNDWRRNWQQFLGVGESLVWRTRCYKKFWLYTADYCCYARKDVEHLDW